MIPRKLYTYEHPVEQAISAIDDILRANDMTISIEYIIYKGNIVDQLETDSRGYWTTLPRSFDTERLAIRGASK